MKLNDENKQSGQKNLSFFGHPFYLKATLILLGLILLVYILHHLESILIPFSFAVLLAILLNKPTSWMIKKKIPRILAIVVSILLTFLVLGAIITFISTQIASFSDMWPEIKSKAVILQNDVQELILQTFRISIKKQDAYLQEALKNNKELIGSTLNSLFGIFSLIALLPIYVFLLLYYKPLIISFLYDAIDNRHSENLESVLSETKSAVQSYVTGLLIETVIVSALNSTVLLILGVKYAVLLGIIGGILNLIPYIGGLVAILLPVIMATITKDGYSTQLMIIVLYSVIQFVDNNYIMPRIVSSKVSLNALVTIVVILLGNALWGVSGMFLSIPALAVVKIIFDHNEKLAPYGRLLGDTLPEKETKRPLSKDKDEP